MRTRWRGLWVFALSMAVIAALACGRYVFDAGPGVVSQVLHQGDVNPHGRR